MNVLRREEEPTLSVADDEVAACRGAELVMVLTDWPQFAHLESERLIDVVQTLDERPLTDLTTVLEAA